jgi:hypothetical protein
MRRGLRLPKWVAQFEHRSRKPRRAILRAFGHRRHLVYEPLEDRSLLSVFTVSNPSDGAVAHSGDLPGSLRQAIYDADTTPGDNTINFDPSLAGGTITLTEGELDLTNTTGTTTITGLGADQLTVSGNHASRVFYVDAGVTAEISGLTITGGLATDGSSGEVTDSGPNYYKGGGGIWNAGTLTLDACTVSDSTAAGSNAYRWVGGGVANIGTMTITDSTVSENSAQGGGGIVTAIGTLTITDSTICGNAATGGPAFSGVGGGIGTGTPGSLTITGSTISGNTASWAGGGISNGGTITVTNSTIAGNSAVSLGGGIYNTGTGTVTVTDSTIAGNSAVDSGAGIANWGTSTITNGTISGNSARYGSGIGNWGGFTLTDSTVSGNSTNSPSGDAGGIENFGGATMTIVHSTISANTAALGGGGIGNWGRLTLTDSTVTQNSASWGGGI